MQFFDAAAVAERLPYEKLIETLDDAFREGAVVPDRTHHTMTVPGGTDATLLLMPAWRSGRSLGVKIASIFPDNAMQGLGAVQAVYVLMDGSTGEPRAVIDGGELTLRRTASASALASRYLSADAARSLLMVGTGNLAPHLIAAHAAARKIERVRIWGRREHKARELKATLARRFDDIEVATDLEAAVRDADIVSCATLSGEALVRGAWLCPGQHIDLVGAFTPQMREADGEAIARARIVVDTYDGAFAEAGDLIQAIDEGFIDKDDIAAELAELARGEKPGRRSADEITLFKSVGTALEDLAAAGLVVDSA